MCEHKPSRRPFAVACSLHRFWSSTDEVRRGEIVQLLKTELAQYFKQILLVSHVHGLEQDVDHMVRLEAGRVTEAI